MGAFKTVQDDLVCSQCKYSLRTLSADADCPECGWPVAQSIAFHQSTRRWKLRLLVIALVTASMATLVLVCVTQFYVRPEGISRARPDWTLYYNLHNRLFVMSVIILAANGLVSLLILFRNSWMWASLLVSTVTMVLLFWAI